MKASSQIKVEPPDVWAETAAARIGEWLCEALSRRRGRRVHVALSGGSTPGPVYLSLSSVPQIDWLRVELYLSDERMVPLDDPQSNYRSARIRLVDRLVPTPPLLHPVATELHAEAAARAYEELIRQRVPPGTNGIPQFDLVLLGMGDDGHTASLFPRQAILHETERLVAESIHPGSNQPRVTFTLPLICSAHRACFLITGGTKAELLGRLFRGDREDDDLPAVLVAKRAPNVVWMLDEAAAGLVPWRENRKS